MISFLKFCPIHEAAPGMTSAEFLEPKPMQCRWERPPLGRDDDPSPLGAVAVIASDPERNSELGIHG